MLLLIFNDDSITHMIGGICTWKTRYVSDISVFATLAIFELKWGNFEGVLRKINLIPLLPE